MPAQQPQQLSTDQVVPVGPIKVSVVVAAYNASAFIGDAIQSASQFPIVSEIIIVDDGSTDDSYSICREFAAKDPRVSVYQHPDKGNHGAGASWNLGVQQCKSEWIAILGADDIFLPNRFDAEASLLLQPDIDAVHGTMTAHFLNQEVKAKYTKRRRRKNWLTGIDQTCPSDQVVDALLGIQRERRGFISLNALTVRKSAFEKIGGFNPILRLHQDADFVIKLAMMGGVVAGGLDKPVCSRGVHEANRILNHTRFAATRSLLYQSLMNWITENGEELTLSDDVVNTIKTRHRIYSLAGHSKGRRLASYAALLFSDMSNLLQPRYFPCHRDTLRSIFLK